MRKAAAIVFLGVMLVSAEAHAVFTYVPEGNPPSVSPIVQENSSQAFSGVPAQQANPLVIPKAVRTDSGGIDPKVGIGPGSNVTDAELAKRERKAAEAEIRKARSNTNRKLEKRYEQFNSGEPNAKPINTAPVPVQPGPAPQNMMYAANQGYQGIQPVYTPAQNAMSAGAPPLVIGRGSMREQLMSYAQGLGYQVAWNCPNDLIVTNETMFSTGTFAGNLRELFETLQRIGRRDMSATLFQGNRTIVVEPARR